MNNGDAQAIMWLGLAVLFVLLGAGTAYALWRVGRVLRGVERDLHRTVDEVVPLIVKAGVSMDQVNDQLAKVDVMMDSAVDITDALDSSVRAVSHAVTEPVRAVSSAVTGAGEAARSFRERMAGERSTAPGEPSSATDPAASAAASEGARAAGATAPPSPIVTPVTTASAPDAGQGADS